MICVLSACDFLENKILRKDTVGSFFLFLSSMAQRGENQLYNIVTAVMFPNAQCSSECSSQ